MTRPATDGGSDDIPAGAEVSGFEVSSENLPGIATFECISNQERTGVDPDILPAWVVEQIEQIPLSVDEAHAAAISLSRRWSASSPAAPTD